MNIAEKLRKNSKQANSEKAKRSLAKTLAEKRKKAKAAALEKERERAALEEELKKEEAKKAKEALELNNLKILKGYFNRFYSSAWNGESIVRANELDLNTSYLLKNFGLSLLSTEDFSKKLNKNLKIINEAISKLNLELSDAGFLSKDLLSRCYPKDIVSEEFLFLSNWAVCESLIVKLRAQIFQKIKALEVSRANLLASINNSKNGARLLAEQLKDLSCAYSRHEIEKFINVYEDALHRPQEITLASHPELRKLTYAERLDNREYQFSIAKLSFLEAGLKLPHPEELIMPSEVLSDDFDYSLSNIDMPGRYIAFFRILCGGDPYVTISRVVKEAITANNSADLAIAERQLLKINLLLQSEKNQLNLVKKEGFKRAASGINNKINLLRAMIKDSGVPVTFYFKEFHFEYLFDISSIRAQSTPDDTFNPLVAEIRWLLSKGGRQNLRKFMKSLEMASKKGLRTLRLSYLQHAEKYLFSQNGKTIFELHIRLENFLKMLEKEKLSYSLKSFKTYDELNIKWL